MTIRFRDTVVVREVEGESVLLDLKRGYYFGLDAAGTRIWQLLQLKPRLRDVVSAMVDEYDVDEGTCARDLVAFVSALCAYGLIEVIGRDGNDGACRDGHDRACRDGHDRACPSDPRCGAACGPEGAAPACAETWLVGFGAARSSASLGRKRPRVGTDTTERCDGHDGACPSDQRYGGAGGSESRDGHDGAL